MSGFGVIEAEDPDVCELCGEFKELRLYGPNGERVCFKCGMKNPEAVQRGFEKLVFGESSHVN